MNPLPLQLTHIGSPGLQSSLEPESGNDSTRGFQRNIEYHTFGLISTGSKWGVSGSGCDRQGPKAWNMSRRMTAAASALTIHIGHPRFEGGAFGFSHPVSASAM